MPSCGSWTSQPANGSDWRLPAAAHAEQPCLAALDGKTGSDHRSLHQELLAKQRENRMKVSIFGLGYVGAVSLACLSRDGHEVIGVDIDAAKLDLIMAGKTPVVEEGMVDLMAAGRPPAAASQ
jgi:hypothetical protein